MTHGINVVALSGRRIDAADAPVPRFPLEHAAEVQRRISAVLRKTHAKLLVCSAACGADLLALEVARELGLDVRVILAFPRERFRQTSVVDRPGEWGPLFDLQMDLAEQEGALHQIDPVDDPQDAYLRVEDAILDQAASRAARSRKGRSVKIAGRVTAVAVWNGQSTGDQDATEVFVRRAHARGFEVCHVPIPPESFGAV